MIDVTKLTDEEIEEKVRWHLKLAIVTHGKGLTDEQKELDKALKKEYWRRDSLKPEQKCILCTQPKFSFYDILHHFCGNMDRIKDNICEIHEQPLSEMATEFLNKR